MHNLIAGSSEHTGHMKAIGDVVGRDCHSSGTRAQTQIPVHSTVQPCMPHAGTQGGAMVASRYAVLALRPNLEAQPVAGLLLFRRRLTGRAVFWLG
jgi:hypothetical protein